MEHRIENEWIALTAADHGAEITSLLYGGKEYIWNGDPAFWGRRTPVLFPFVGQVRGGSYRYEGRTYPMGQHGFARDMEFTLKEETENSLSFVLRDNETSYAVYPLHFELEIRYTLEGRSVAVEWIVRNPGEKELHFSIGGHPAFMCPIEGRGTWADYAVAFEKDGRPLDTITIRPITSGGNVGREVKEIALHDGKITPTAELFAGDALILEGEQADAVALVDPDGKEYLKVSFDTPLVGVWSPVGKNAPFICIEPWCGRTDADDFEGDLTEREYGNKLSPREEFHRTYTIQVG